MKPRFLAQDEPEAEDAEGKALQQQHMTVKCSSLQEDSAKAIKGMAKKLHRPREGGNNCKVIPRE